MSGARRAGDAGEAGQLAAEVAAALREASAGLDAVVAGLDLDLPTPAEPWTVRDTIAHLHASDRAGLAALAGQDLAGHVGPVLAGRYAGPDLIGDWRRDREALVSGALARPAGAGRIPWFGPPMSPVSFLAARLMETWAHGVDVRDAAGLPVPDGPGLRFICELGVRTHDWSYAVRGLDPPPRPRVQLGHGRDSWVWDGESGAGQLSGAAVDFALLVTQRRHRDDLQLAADGPGADRWLDVAQAFAGPPGPGRRPLSGPGR